MEVANNNKKIKISWMDTIFLVTGIVIAVSFSIVLWVYNSLISDDILMIPAILLHTISLAIFLFRSRKLIFLWIGFIFVLLIFNVTTFTRSSLLLYSISVSLLLVPPVSLILTSLPSAIDQINVELLGRLYTWIFFVQFIFLIFLIYVSEADICVKSMSSFAVLVLSSIMIYDFDKQVRSSSSSSNANTLASYYSMNKSTHKEKSKLNNLIKPIERFLYTIKCSTKPVVEELENATFLGILILLFATPILLSFLGVESLRPIITVGSSAIAATIFTLSIGIKLYNKCKINIIFLGILPVILQSDKSKKPSKGSIIFASILIIVVISTIIRRAIYAQINLTLSLFLILVALIFTIPLTITATAIQIIDIIKDATPQTTKHIDMTQLVFSLTIFMAFVIYSIIMCLRHGTKCEEL